VERENKINEKVLYNELDSLWPLIPKRPTTTDIKLKSDILLEYMSYHNYYSYNNSFHIYIYIYSDNKTSDINGNKYCKNGNLQMYKYNILS